MIATPRGLVIYLPRDYSFALIARLYPKFDAFYVLETTQGIHKIHSLAAFVCGMTCFLLRLQPIQIASWTICITFLFYLMRLFGAFVIPGMVYFSKLFSRVTGYGFVTVMILVVGLWRVGILGTVAYLLARLVVEGLTMLIDDRVGTKLGMKMGVDPLLAKAGSMYFAPGWDFVNAYKLLAPRCPVQVDVEVTKEELEQENWIHVWDDLVEKWPEVARRFQKDELKAS